MNQANGNQMIFGSIGRLAGVCGCCALLLMGVPAPLVAQEVSVAEARAGFCMVRAPLVSGVGQAETQPVIVPASDVEAMIERGFLAVPCGTVFESVEVQRRWRDTICTMTATQGAEVQDQLEMLLGERPAVLCGMAEQVLGPWQRGGE